MNRPIKILVVEDEAFIALAMRIELEKAGYIVCDLVATGEEAIEKTLLEKPDLILMDTNLAGEMNGIEAARIILSSQSTPIVFITGYSEEDIRKRAESISPLGYITKPAKIHQIQEFVRQIQAQQE